MQTSKWGPSAWTYLHTLSFNYPETNPTQEQRKNYYDLFYNLQFTLPCKYCRETYTIFFKYIDINQYLDDRMGITFWVFTIHNIVNMKLNKKLANFFDVVKYYENMRANENDIKCNYKLCVCNNFICCCVKICNCSKCTNNIDYVNKTKSKYNNITKKFVEKLIECNELKN
jgi:hypothetical protein